MDLWGEFKLLRENVVWSQFEVKGVNAWKELTWKEVNKVKRPCAGLKTHNSVRRKSSSLNEVQLSQTSKFQYLLITKL